MEFQTTKMISFQNRLRLSKDPTPQKFAITRGCTFICGYLTLTYFNNLIPSLSVQPLSSELEIFSVKAILSSEVTGNFDLIQRMAFGRGNYMIQIAPLNIHPDML